MSSLATLNKLGESVITYLEISSQRKNWMLNSCALCFILIMVTSFPPFEMIDWRSWDLLILRSRQPFEPLPPEYITDHTDKYAFRFLVPMIGGFLKLNKFGFFASQVLCGVFFLVAIHRISLKVNNDRVIAILSSAAFSMIFVGKWGFYDLYMHFDVVAWLLLALAMISPRWWIMVPVLLASYFTDERALIASPLIFLWWKWFELPGKNMTARDSLVPGMHSRWVPISWIMYFVVRFSLASIAGLETGTQAIGWEVFLFNYKFFPLAILLCLEGWWLFIILAAIRLINNGMTTFLLLNVLAASVVLFVALNVYDVSRSSAYVYPVVFLSMAIVASDMDKKVFRKVVLTITVVCSLIPTMEFYREVFWLSPIFPKIIKLL